MVENKLYQRLGDYIQLVDCRNKDSKITNLLGINITKNFMPSVANVSGTDLSKYKVIKKGQFAYSAMQVGRDETIRLALYLEDEPAIISPAYLVIESKDIQKLLPEYMMMWFQRPESDRYGWFISDASVRASLDWERLCDIKIPIPTLVEQQKYVAIYQGVLDQQKNYENSLTDLQLVCDEYIENLLETEMLQSLEMYIERTEERNFDNQIRNVKGMSTEKLFRSPNSRVNHKLLSNYRVVKNKEFAYVPTTDTWRCLAIAISNFEHPIVVSPIYITFKIKDELVLLPEYLYLFLSRDEMDRYARFNSWGSARENFNWDEMCNVKIPVPSIEKQQAIVNIYHALQARKAINEQLKESIKPLCPVLMRGVVEEVIYE